MNKKQPRQDQYVINLPRRWSWLRHHIGKYMKRHKLDSMSAAWRHAFCETARKEDPEVQAKYEVTTAQERLEGE